MGDYRRWVPGYEEKRGKRRKVEEDKWGEDHELWRMDLRDFDLGIVEDKIERAAREAYTKYLLVDPKSRRLVVVVPSVMPHPLLNILLGTLFSNFSMSSITLLSPPILSAVASGCRSAMVVDIGWRETTVTAVYDYREISQSMTTRAMRTVNVEMAKLLEQYDRQDQKDPPAQNNPEAEEKEKPPTLSVTLEQAEEATTRLAWIPPTRTPQNPTSPSPSISLPSPSSPTQSIQIPFPTLAEPIENALLPRTPHPDDNEHPLPLLIYTSLLHLPPDVRATCMSRILFTGGGANIPGLKPRLVDEVTMLVHERGWNSGDARRTRQQQLQKAEKQNIIQEDRQLNSITEVAPPPSAPHPSDSTSTPLIPSLLPQETDEITEKLHREKIKGTKQEISGLVRGVETLGAWAGASLVANLRIKGVVEVERDAFLQHGLAGTRKEGDVGVGRERGVWTLGAWG